MGEVSKALKKIWAIFIFKKKLLKLCQIFGQLVLAVWSRADWPVWFSPRFLEFCWNIKIPHFWKKSNHATVRPYNIEILQFIMPQNTYKMGLFWFSIMSSNDIVWHINIYRMASAALQFQNCWRKFFLEWTREREREREEE